MLWECAGGCGEAKVCYGNVRAAAGRLGVATGMCGRLRGGYGLLWECAGGCGEAKVCYGNVWAAAGRLGFATGMCGRLRGG